jgi:predicted peptidase
MAGRQEPQKFSARITIDVQSDYLLYLPKGYGSDGKEWPLALFLHGSGERGKDLELVKRHGPPMLVAEGMEFPFILVSPQCPGDEYWSAPTLKALIDHLLGRYDVDRSRIYLTGLSRGGVGTWNTAIAYPDLFAAIVPICAWGDPSGVSVLKHVPTWAFHGRKDTTIAFERGEAMVKGLQEAGGNVRLTAYPEAGHDCWIETYANPDLYTWMLKQRKAE